MRYAAILMVLIVVSSAGFLVFGMHFKIAHDPIHIIGDGNFTAQNGVTGGSGTADDPYIIEGWEINASTSHGIWIENTHAHVVIRNCTVYDGVIGDFHGIYIYNAENVTLENCTVINDKDGILIKYSGNILIKNCDVRKNDWYGIYITLCSNITVVSSYITNNGEIGIWIEDSHNINLDVLARNNTYTGIYISGSQNSTVSGIIDNSSINGVNIYNSRNITIGSKISHARYGLNCWYSQLTFSGEIYGCYYGIRASDTSVEVSNTILRENIYQIYLRGGEGVLINLTSNTAQNGIWGEQTNLRVTSSKIFGKEGMKLKNSSLCVEKSTFSCEGLGIYLDNCTKIEFQDSELLNDSIFIKGDELSDFYINVMNTTVNKKPVIVRINSTQNTTFSDAGEIILVNYSGFIENISMEGGDCGMIVVFSNAKILNASLKEFTYAIYSYKSYLEYSGNLESVNYGIYAKKSIVEANVFLNSTEYGIYLVNSSANITGYIENSSRGLFSQSATLNITNTTFQSCYRGIELMCSSLTTINSNFTGGEYGIYSFVSRVCVSYGKFSTTVGGIYGEESKINIDKSAFFGSRYGIHLKNCAGCKIKNTSFTGNSIFVEGSERKHFYMDIENVSANGREIVYLSNTTISFSAENCSEVILLNASGNISNLCAENITSAVICAFSDITLKNCTVNSSVIAVYTSNSDITVNDVIIGRGDTGIKSSSSNLSVSDSSINNCSYSGIFLYNSSAEVSYSTLKENFVGINSLNSRVTVKNVTVEKNGRGIKLVGSDNSYIVYSIFAENLYGLYIQNTSYCKVENNTFSRNTEGIFLIMSQYNRIIYNNFTRSESYAIEIIYLSNYNEIHHNNFWYNNNASDNYDPQHVQVKDDCINYWSSQNGGNFWSDWTSPDSNGDGIVDSPYTIDSDSRDDKPLVNPVEGDFPVSELSIIPFFSILLLSYLCFSWRKLRIRR